MRWVRSCGWGRGRGSGFLGRGVRGVHDDGPGRCGADGVRLGGERGRRERTRTPVTISLDAPAVLPVTVNYATADGTARAGEDYTGVAGSVTFVPGG